MGIFLVLVLDDIRFHDDIRSKHLIRLVHFKLHSTFSPIIIQIYSELEIVVVSGLGMS